MNYIVASRIAMLEELIRNHPDSKTSTAERELLEELKEQQKPKREKQERPASGTTEAWAAASLARCFRTCNV